MSFIIQMQRRAIEALKGFFSCPWPAEAFQDQDVSFLLGNDSRGECNQNWLTYLGMSEGVGSCSDIHGMDVVVLGYGPENWSELEQGGENWRWHREPNWKRLSGCAYAVLLWPNGHRAIPILETLHAGQVAHEVQRINIGACQSNVGTVELLQFSSFKKWSYRENHHTDVYLPRTGLIASYIQMV